MGVPGFEWYADDDRDVPRREKLVGSTGERDENGVLLSERREGREGSGGIGTGRHDGRGDISDGRGAMGFGRTNGRSGLGSGVGYGRSGMGR